MNLALLLVFAALFVVMIFRNSVTIFPVIHAFRVAVRTEHIKHAMAKPTRGDVGFRVGIFVSYVVFITLLATFFIDALLYAAALFMLWKNL